MSTTSIHPIVHRFIEEAGQFTQSLGLGRAIGQLYGYLYFSPQPKGLADMQEALGISKGSASTTVRQLEQWGAARKVWVKGDRKDYYEANDWLGQILRNVLQDTVARRLSQSNGLFSGEVANGFPVGSDGEFIRARLANLQRFQQHAKRAWSNPIVKKLLK